MKATIANNYNFDEVKVIVGENGKMPIKNHSTDSGYDLSSSEDCVVKAGKFKLIGSDVSVVLPVGFEIQVRSRSGLAAKKGVFVLNSPGTVDNGYTGEIKVVLANFGDEDFIVNKGDRIAQLVIAPVYNIPFKSLNGNTEEEFLTDNHRGEKGFGSSKV